MVETHDGNTETIPSPVRVYGFIDGFNLYHALMRFDPVEPVPDPDRYQKYKWLCLTSLMKRYLVKSEELVGVELFTAYPNWPGSEQKKFRHQIFVSAQRSKGVHVTFGEFKTKKLTCEAVLGCHKPFETYTEKQTDINIATSLISFADNYDKAILLTADSDQVPAVRLLKTLHPEKRVAILPPIGRGAKELARVCDQKFKMTEEHLIACQLPNPLPIINGDKQTSILVKPTTWP